MTIQPIPHSTPINNAISQNSDENPAHSIATAQTHFGCRPKMTIQPIPHSTPINNVIHQNSDENPAHSIAAAQTDFFLEKLSIELIFSISQYLSPYDWLALTMTCKNLYKYKNEYWMPRLVNQFRNLDTVHAFLNAKYDRKNIDGEHYFLNALREAMFKKKIKNDVHLPSLLELIKKPFHLRKLEDLYKAPIHLLQEDAFSNIDLKPQHIRHLLSNSSLLILASGGEVNLYALSEVPENFISHAGMIDTIELEEEAVLANMKASGLFVNAIDESYDYFRTPMHIAAESGDMDAVEKLLELAAQPSLTVKDGEGYTPLKLALKNGHNEIANRLRQAYLEC